MSGTSLPIPSILIWFFSFVFPLAGNVDVNFEGRDVKIVNREETQVDKNSSEGQRQGQLFTFVSEI